MATPIATAQTTNDPTSTVTAQVSRLAKTWRISKAGIEYVASWEAFRSHLYDHDGGGQGGNATIGYGHLVHAGPISGVASETPYLNGITENDAKILLKSDLSDPERIVNAQINVPLFQYEFDALVDFVYNLRHHNDGLLNLVNTGQYDHVPAKFLEYTSAGGKHPPGLVARRQSEGNLFRTGNYDATH